MQNIISRQPECIHVSKRMLKIKRAYDRPSRGDGKRVLVDRLWPRGLKREEANLDEWLKELGPSPELRKWFGHDPDKWDSFKKKFFQELQRRQETVDRLAGMARNDTVTLLYGSREEHYNNAVALREYLETRLDRAGAKKAA